LILRTLRNVTRRLAGACLLLAACALTAEGVSRLVHWKGAPLLPYTFVRHAALLPPQLDLRASFNRLAPIRYVTDAGSARIGVPSLADRPFGRDVLAVGDSQVLGYMIEFHQGFASLVAARLCGSPDRARILAAPANHPGNYAEMLEHYGRSAPLRPRLLVVGLNLGNDLDELYGQGLSNDRQDTGRLESWLVRRSYAYMDWVLIRNHWLRTSEEPMGINPILYLLTSPERMRLARETVEELDAVLRSPRVAAEQTVIVITPSDYQVDPAQLEKYRQYYRTEAAFRKWHEGITAYAAMMNALEAFTARELASRGYTVVRLSILLEGERADAVFDPWSHHLTPRGHQLLASAIVDVGAR
jgi:hypothetical protein